MIERVARVFAVSVIVALAATALAFYGPILWGSESAVDPAVDTVAVTKEAPVEVAPQPAPAPQAEPAAAAIETGSVRSHPPEPSPALPDLRGTLTQSGPLVSLPNAAPPAPREAAPAKPPGTLPTPKKPPATKALAVAAPPRSSLLDDWRATVHRASR